MKRGQASNEALMIIGFMTIMLIALLGVISNQLFESGSLQQQEALANVADYIEQELQLASTAEVGYTRTFTIPPTIEGREYDLSFLSRTDTRANFTLLVLSTQIGSRRYDETRLLPANIEGAFVKGTNRVQKAQTGGKTTASVNTAPVIHLRFDERADWTIKESGQFGIDGKHMNENGEAGPTYQEGVVAESIYFRTATGNPPGHQYAAIPYSDSWQLGQGDFTILLWAKRDEGEDAYDYWQGSFSGSKLSKTANTLLTMTGSSCRGVTISDVDDGGVAEFGRLHVQLSEDATADCSGSEKTTINVDNILPAEWTMIGVRRSGASVQVFVNGVVVKSGVGSLRDVSVDGSLLVSSSVAEESYTGHIDNVRIWKGALSDAFIYQLYLDERPE